MSGTDAAFSTRRVVALLPSVSAAETLPERLFRRLEVVVVTGCYEAAAEILAEPALALVLDLRAFRAGHGRLLEIARQMGLDIFAVGAVSRIDTEQLSGIKLVGRKDLTGELVRLLGGDDPEVLRQGDRQVSGTPPQSRANVEPGPEGHALDDPAVADDLEGAAEAADDPEESEQLSKVPWDVLRRELLGKYIAEQEVQNHNEVPGQSASSVLTPDEIAALLEDEQ